MRRWSETVRRTARPSWETPRGTSSLAEMDGGYPCLRGAIWPMCLTTRRKTPANSANPLAAARGREPRLLTSVGAPRKKPPDGSRRRALLRFAKELSCSPGAGAFEEHRHCCRSRNFESRSRSSESRSRDSEEHLQRGEELREPVEELQESVEELREPLAGRKLHRNDEEHLQPGEELRRPVEELREPGAELRALPALVVPVPVMPALVVPVSVVPASVVLASVVPALLPVEGLRESVEELREPVEGL